MAMLIIEEAPSIPITSDEGKQEASNSETLPGPQPKSRIKLAEGKVMQELEISSSKLSTTE
ncbi:MAG: hypothetical protein RAK21_05225 [Synechococcus sp. SP2 MAG]|nr:hypothetical protein [Synechococcus sp. SP2 MAG]